MRTLLILALLAACARPPETVPDSTVPPAVSTEGITLRTDKQRYRPGEAIELTLVNGTASSYSYNPCARIIERGSGSTWAPVREDRMCTMIAHILDPNATRVERTELAQQMAPGRYRVVVLLSESRTDGSSRSVRATSAPIDVGG